MSTEKHQQLIDEGKLHPDGTLKVVCPTCGRELPPGEQLPHADADGDATATASTVVVDTATTEG